MRARPGPAGDRVRPLPTPRRRRVLPQADRASGPTPVFLFEGEDEPLNLSSLEELSVAARGNKTIHFHAVAGADHFRVIVPVTKLIAEKIRCDDGG